jgi:hypothetical protein
MTTFTAEETEALENIVSQWIGEGFTTPPYAPAVSSVIRKLGLTEPTPLNRRHHR